MTAIYSNNTITLKELVNVSHFNTDLKRPENLNTVAIIDLETTGVDFEKSEITEIAYNIIEYDNEGNFYRIVKRYNSLNEVNDEISRGSFLITGITKESLCGHRINWDEVAKDMETVNVVCSFNARFERAFLERYCDVFKNKYFACAMTEIPYLELVGFKGSQEILLSKICGVYYQAHGAMHDVNALSLLLSSRIPSGLVSTQEFRDSQKSQNLKTQKTFFSAMMETSIKPEYKVIAKNAPFEIKDNLKEAGYKWDWVHKVWYTTCTDTEAESKFLKGLGSEVSIHQITGYNRFKN